VRARAALRAEADRGRTRLTVLRSQAPLVLRPAAGAVYLAAGGGGPIGGDDLELTVEVGPGAELTLRTVAATVALPGALVSLPGARPRSGSAVTTRSESRLVQRFSVAEGGRLTVLPEPTVIADRARHRVRIEVDVAPGGALLLRDEVVLGRYGEAGGSYRGLLRVDVGGAPLLRHELVLDGGELSPAIGARANGSLLVVDSDQEFRAAGGADWAVLPLAGPGALVTALAEDARTLRARLDLSGLSVPAECSGCSGRS
jgi:urease accessory protein